MWEKCPKIFNSYTIKIIAVITMIIDHIGFLLFPQYHVLRYIGRIAFPLFVFLLVEGFQHTKDVRKYELRMLVFALISEIPFDMFLKGHCMYWLKQNVFFTLLIGLIVLDLYEHFCGQYPVQMVIILAGILLAQFVVHSDYGGAGVALIVCFYLFRKRPLLQLVSLALIAFLVFGGYEPFGIIAFLPIMFYNGERGPKLNKYIFYVIYPLQFFVLATIGYGLACFRL